MSEDYIDQNTIAGEEVKGKFMGEESQSDDDSEVNAKVGNDHVDFSLPSGIFGF